MSGASYWCEHCDKFVSITINNEADKLKKFILSLLLCPIGFCLLPYFHPKFNSHQPICPICSEIIDTTCDDMSSFGTCKLCGEKICYSPEHLDSYGAHLIENHPEIDFAHFALIYEPAARGAQSSACGCPFGCGCAHGDCNKKLKSSGRRSLNYKTTIQSWKCGPHSQHCPRCGNTSPPLIRRQRHKLTTSNWIACMLLGCWPICFLPFIISGSDLFYLYCKDCGYYIGVYDRRVSATDREVPPCRLPATGSERQICGCR